MKYKLRLTGEFHRRLAGALRAALPRESVVFLLCRRIESVDAVVFLAGELVSPQASDYRMQDTDIASIAPAAMVAVAKRARQRGLIVIMAHVHPGCDGDVEFSVADYIGNDRSFAFFHQRVKAAEHLALVFDEPSTTCRGLVYLANGKRVVLDSCAVVDAQQWVELSGGIPKSDAFANVYARQALLLGTAGQRRLSASKVAIVGLGGIGSVVNALAVHHGLHDVVLVDDDTIEQSNLPRVIGATPSDVVGKLAKVDIAKRYGATHAPGASIRAVRLEVENPSTLSELVACDVIVVCTDNTTSRAFINQFAQQYLVSVLDLGVELVVGKDGSIVNEVGRVNLARPGTACLHCTGQIDARRLAAESVPAAERKREGSYLRGLDDPQPSMMAFNMEIAARGMQVLVGFLSGVMPVSLDTFELRTFFRRRAGSLSRLVAKRRDPQCLVCGDQGVVGLGGTLPMAITRRAA